MTPLRNVDRDTRRARLLAARTRPATSPNRSAIYGGFWDGGNVVGQFRSGRGCFLGLAPYAPKADADSGQ